MKRLPLLALALSSVLGCSSRDGAVAEPIAAAASPVVHGELDDPPKYDSVVFFQTYIGSGLLFDCSGVMLSPHLIVTARHCVQRLSADETKFGAAFDVSSTWILVGAFANVYEKTAPDAKVFTVVHGAEKVVMDADLALIVTNTPLPGPFAPIRLASAPAVGETVAVAGFGWTEHDDAAISHHRYRREGLSILALGPDASNAAQPFGAKELELGESICSGDSGGPVFDQASGALLATRRARRTATRARAVRRRPSSASIGPARRLAPSSPASTRSPT